MEEENKNNLKDSNVIENNLKESNIIEDCFEGKLNKHGQLEDEGACEDEI